MQILKVSAIDSFAGMVSPECTTPNTFTLGLQTVSYLFILPRASPSLRFLE